MEKETAMKILKKLHGKSLFAERTALETLIPELKESEDEKIRKEILEFVEIMANSKSSKKWIAWLEEQAEQKSTEWSEEDDAYKELAICAVANFYDEENPLNKCIVNWLKSLKDKIKEK